MSEASVRVDSLESLQSFANALTKRFAPRQLLLLDGPMGAGKTELARAICRALGVDREASSPTFAIHHVYLGTRDGQSIEIDHFDLFRIESAEDLESAGLWDTLAVPGRRLVLIEWPERIGEELRPPVGWRAMHLRIEFVEGTESSRLLTESVV